jgi:hypothetical protein
MGKTVLMFVLLTAVASGERIPEEVVEKQDAAFQRWWNADFVWKYAELPTQGHVPEFRVPYSGYIYPDHAGGTAETLRKYDGAFSSGYQYPATDWEHWDTTAYKKPVEGLLGFLGARETPRWYGHCNGWTSAAIRHAEPQQAVRSRGVVFSPADIKALLAEIYMYNDVDMLAGQDHQLDAGTFHAILANWLGRGSHPLGLELDPGEEKWNYPLYAFASAATPRSPRRIEVNTNIRYAKDSVDGEYDESPEFSRVLFFHYVLDLNEQGEIIGGQFLDDSSLVDMLWVPLQPKPAGQDGNEGGNPHVDVDMVLALWRASVSEETRRKWMIVDPSRQDRVIELDEQPQLVARGTEVIVVKPPQPEPQIDHTPLADALLANQDSGPQDDARATPRASTTTTVANRPTRTRLRISPNRRTSPQSGMTSARWLE